jgi:CHAT domain-containing protein
MRRIAAALALSGALTGGCRPPASSADLDAAIERARAVQRDDGPRAALPLLQQALTAARAAGSRHHEGLALGHLGTAYKNLADYPQALRHHEQALAIKRGLGDEVEEAKTLNNIGLVEEARGNCVAALDLYGRSLEIFTRHARPGFAASVLNNQALCHDALGEFDKSMATYERALALHRASGNEAGQSETLGNIGGVHLLLGRYREAISRYDEAYAISRRLDATQSMVLDLINLGAARSAAGAFDQARDDLTRARTLAQAAGLAREDADAARALARLDELSGRYDDARRRLADAAGLYDRAGLARESVDALHAMGLLDLATGDLGAAAERFERAADAAARLKYFTGRVASLLAQSELEMRRRHHTGAQRHAVAAQMESRAAGDLARESAATLMLARVHLAAGRGDDAREAAEHALGLARRSTGALAEAEARLQLAEALRALGRTSDAIAELDRAEALDGVGDVAALAWRLAFARGRALESAGRLDDALVQFLAAVESIERTRHGLASDRTRTGFLDDKREVYTALIRLLLRLGRSVDAFDVAERLRAEGYIALLARSAALARAPGIAIPAELVSRLRQLQQSLEDELRQAQTDRRGAALGSYRQAIRDAEADWARAVAALTGTPGLSRPRVPDARTVQRHLGLRDALVQFVVGADATVAFVLTRQALNATVLPVAASDLRTRIELLRALVARQDSSEWEAPATRLDLELIEPLRRAGWLQGVTRLLIVPHAELNYLPFAVLRRATPGAVRLLVEDYSLSVRPAATALVQSSRRVSPARTLLALAPARPRLPFARQEVESLGALFPAARREVLVGARATEAEFKRAAGQYRIVHLATHGFFNRINPLFSGIDLEPGPGEDGRLQVYEILGLSLAADLVTLSACDTALGAGELTDLPAGEELVGLTRAFLSAGSRHVLATLWEISDEATASLMAAFYRNARSQPARDALAAVMRRQIAAGGRAAHPYYWAPFVIVGASDTESARLGP